MRFTINPFTNRFDAFELSLSPLGNVDFLTGDTGGAVSPDVGQNINILGGPGIEVNGVAGTHTLTVKLNGGVEASGVTVGAVTIPLITLPLGAVPGMYLFKIDIVGFDAITPLGCSYYMTGGARTTGAAAIEIAGQISDDFEEGALSANVVDLAVAGNNVLINVTGTAGKTINWTAVLTYTFRS